MLAQKIVQIFTVKFYMYEVSNMNVEGVFQAYSGHGIHDGHGNDHVRLFVLFISVFKVFDDIIFILLINC